jgi:hypothetical protein
LVCRVFEVDVAVSVLGQHLVVFFAREWSILLVCYFNSIL